MTTVGEKTADLGTLLDDWATTLLSFTEWTDADTTITNDQSDENWRNNGRVLQNSNMGVYVLAFLADSEYYDQNGNRIEGIRVVFSNNWDSSNHVPSGNTTVDRKGPFSGDVANHAQDSYTSFEVDKNNNNPQGGIWVSNSHSVSSGRTGTAALNASYIIGADAGYFNVGAWDNTDGNNGEACLLCLEWMDNKFWNDATDPWTVVQRLQDELLTIYGFQALANSNQSNEAPYLGYASNDYRSAIEVGDWGLINPDTNDDTFFFRRPTVYQTSTKRVPVAYFRGAIPNQASGGAAHGDTITYDGTDYYIVDQTGGDSSSQPVSHGVKFV